MDAKITGTGLVEGRAGQYVEVEWRLKPSVIVTITNPILYNVYIKFQGERTIYTCLPRWIWPYIACLLHGSCRYNVYVVSRIFLWVQEPAYADNRGLYKLHCPIDNGTCKGTPATPSPLPMSL